ncbi:MAG: phosphocholine cytidylyltransferase family protein [Pseudomonadota bacterium]
MTRAIILAAGEGTRLRPLTNDKPKCMVELLGVPLVERQIACLKSQGIHDIHIATGYRSEQIEALGYPTTRNNRYDRTNMVATLFTAVDFIDRPGDLIIAYGDIVYDVRNLQQILACDDDIALMVDEKWRDLWSVRMDDPLADAETLLLDDAGYVTELGKKPDGYEQIQGQYTGLIKISADRIKDLLAFYESLDRDELYDGKKFDDMYMTSFLQALIGAGWRAKAVLVKNGWLEVDSVEDLARYEELAEQNELVKFYAS